MSTINTTSMEIKNVRDKSLTSGKLIKIVKRLQAWFYQ